MPRLGRDATLLLVDDDPDLLPSLVATMEALSDFTIITAANGADALERVMNAHPDCVVIDVRMPQLDGFQVVRAIRGDPATMNIPVVILTALANDEDRFIGLASGVDQFLTKPARPRELLAAIETAMRLADNERERQLSYLLNEVPPTPDTATSEVPI